MNGPEILGLKQTWRRPTGIRLKICVPIDTSLAEKDPIDELGQMSQKPTLGQMT